MFKCFVRGHILGTFAISMVPLLYSKILQQINGVGTCATNLCSDASLAKDKIGNMSLVDVEREMYSASVVDKAISVCNLETHSIGLSAKFII